MFFIPYDALDFVQRFMKYTKNPVKRLISAYSDRILLIARNKRIWIKVNCCTSVSQRVCSPVLLFLQGLIKSHQISHYGHLPN